MRSHMRGKEPRCGRDNRVLTRVGFKGRTRRLLDEAPDLN